MNAETGQRVGAEQLQQFCLEVFERVGVDAEDARITAEVLVAADVRGIASHGVAHLRRYVDGLRAGTISAQPAERVVIETMTTATIDAGAGLGPPVSQRAMRKAIAKADEAGVGFVAVRNSNHYGIAGYYAMLALAQDCIGLALTNASPRVVPTFGRRALFGTNPIAVAIPAADERPLVLDMATSTVAQGKLEIADQLDKPIPLGWAVDSDGRPTTDARRALDELKRGAGAGLLPLGGAGELMGGHKGYGLALVVEVLSAVLSGAAFATATYPRTREGHPLPANLGHFFGAWRIDGFRPAHEFKADVDALQRLLKSSPPAEGAQRIYLPGEKEFEAEAHHRRTGVALNPVVAGELRSLASELGVAVPWDEVGPPIDMTGGAT